VKGVRRRRVRALFPAYVFVRVELGEQALGPIKSADGVRGIVKFGDDYAVVPPGVIQALLGREEPDSGLHAVDEWTPKKYDTVRINDGPFEGLEGMFLRLSGKDRVLVLLSILGRPTPINIDEMWIEQSTTGKVDESLIVSVV
jgi:transcriptional antiterminator RfaH